MFNLLSIPEVAERLGTSPRFVRRLIAERRICHYKIGRGQGGHVRIDQADLIAFITAGRVEADP